jgi:hypothetical protein
LKFGQVKGFIIDRESGGFAVALLVFLPGAAGARIVAADLCGSASGFGRVDRSRARPELHLLLLAALLAFDFFR